MNAYKKSSILIITLLLFVGVACDRNEEPRLAFAQIMAPVLSPNDTVFSLGIESNTDWTLVSDASWCTPSQSAGYECTEVQVAVTANDEQGERTATLTLCSADGLLIQTLMSNPYCSLCPMTIRYHSVTGQVA